MVLGNESNKSSLLEDILKEREKQPVGMEDVNIHFSLTKPVLELLNKCVDSEQPDLRSRKQLIRTLIESCMMRLSDDISDLADEGLEVPPSQAILLQVHQVGRDDQDG